MHQLLLLTLAGLKLYTGYLMILYFLKNNLSTVHIYIPVKL